MAGNDNVLGERLKQLRAELTQPDIVEQLARKGVEIKQAQAVTAEQAVRGKARRLADTPYLVSRLVVCELHHGYMTVDNVRYKDGCYHYVTCRRCKPRQCVHVEQVLDVLRAAIAYLQDAASRAALLADLEQSDAAILGQIEALQRQVKQTDQAVQRADDAYVTGVMDSERYSRQVQRLAAQRQQQMEAIASLQQELGTLRQNASRGERLDEIANVGLAALQSSDTAAANAWLRRHFVVYAGGGAVTRVDYL